MPRPVMTPDTAARVIAQHADACAVATKTLRDALATPGAIPSDDLLHAAKTLEAAGCYVRRAQAKGLI